MSKAAAATASADAAVDVAPPKGKKKLIVILLAVLLLVLAGGGAAVYVMKQKAAAAAAALEDDDYEDEDEEVETAAQGEARRKEHANRQPPVFVALEPFVVNLADKESDRYAQVGVTLEVEDPKFAEEMKIYMPAIRNGILMVLSHKTSAQLLTREGKLALAREIMRESVLPLGIEVRDESDEEGAPARRRKPAGAVNPVKRVHFSNFIVQ